MQFSHTYTHLPHNNPTHHVAYTLHAKVHFCVSIPQVFVFISVRPTLTFMHLADAFIQSDLQCIQGYTFFIVSMCVPWELNPRPLRC